MPRELRRADIVNAARSYLRVPWVHQGRDPSIGLDCGGLLIRVGLDLSDKLSEDFVAALREEEQNTHYTVSPDWRKIRAFCSTWMDKVRKEYRLLHEGDVLQIAYRRYPLHLGFVADYVHGGLSVIHCYGLRSPPPKPKNGEVTEHALTEDFFEKKVRFVYRYPGAI